MSWFPGVNDVVVVEGRAPSYAKSVVIGLTSPLLHLWLIVLLGLVVPLLTVLVRFVTALFRAFVVVPMLGFMGRLSSREA